MIPDARYPEEGGTSVRQNSGCDMSGWNGGGVIPDAICRGRMLAAESSECEMSG